MLTYSVKPRGGVVHALEVSEALARRGHEVELMALARPDEELFRPTARAACGSCATSPTEPEFDERILGMLDAYTEGLAPLLRRLRRRALAGLPVGQRRARAARSRA